MSQPQEEWVGWEFVAEGTEEYSHAPHTFRQPHTTYMAMELDDYNGTEKRLSPGDVMKSEHNA